MRNIQLVVCVNQRLGAGKQSCGGSGSRELIDTIKQHLSDMDLNIPIKEQVCLGRCAEGIAMRIAPAGPFFTQVTEKDIAGILEALKNLSETP